MRRQFNNIVSVVYTFFRILIWKILHGKNLKVGMIERFSPNVVCEFNRGSKLSIGSKVRIHSGTKIKVRRNSSLKIGAGVKINYNCIFVCHDNIEIGEGTEFGPSVYLYDHDHDFRAGLKNGKYKSAPIIIGKNCWIGANTIILRGTIIGDNCVIGAGSVIKGIYDSNSIIIQQRETKSIAIT